MDCSVTKRKGCNYCLRGKAIKEDNAWMLINDDDCNGNAEVQFSIVAEHGTINERVKINYCPICGKDLKRRT